MKASLEASESSPALSLAQNETSKNLPIVLEIREEYHGDDPCIVRISDDFAFVAIGFEHGKVVIKQNNDLNETKKTIGPLTKIGVFDANDDCIITDIRFVHINKERREAKVLCVTYTSGYVRIWRFTRDKSRRLQSEVLEENEGTPNYNQRRDNNTPLCCSFSYDNKHIVVGGTDTVIRVYEAETLKLERLCKCSNIMGSSDGHLMQVCAITYHPMGAQQMEYIRVFVSASWDNTVKIWQDDHCQCLWSYNFTYVCSNDALDICPVTNVICAGNWSTDLPAVSLFHFNTTIVSNHNSPFFQVKSFSSGRSFDKSCTSLLRKALTLPSRNYVTKFLDQRTMLLGGGNENCFNVIDVKSGETLLTVTGFPKSILSAAVLRKGENWYPCSVCFCCDNILYALTIRKPEKCVVDIGDLKLCHDKEQNSTASENARNSSP